MDLASGLKILQEEISKIQRFKKRPSRPAYQGIATAVLGVIKELFERDEYNRVLKWNNEMDAYSEYELAQHWEKKLEELKSIIMSFIRLTTATNHPKTDTQRAEKERLADQIYNRGCEKIEQDANEEKQNIIARRKGTGTSGYEQGQLLKVDFRKIHKLCDLRKSTDLEVVIGGKLLTEDNVDYLYNRVKEVVDPQAQHLKSTITESYRSQNYPGVQAVIRQIEDFHSGVLSNAKRDLNIELKRNILQLGKTQTTARKVSPYPLLDYKSILQTEFNYTKYRISTKLRFFKDKRVKSIIHQDIEMAILCRHHKLWKPCVILCGGVIEGILQNKIKAFPASQIIQVYSKIYPNKKLKKLEDYTLENILDAAAGLNIIESSTSKSGHAVRDYRNYIHPAKESKQKHSISDKDANIACQFIFKLLDEI